MSTCTLRLDQIQILNKRSDTDHSDNDWLIVTWFVGPNHVRTDTVPLYNKDGSVILDTGNTLQPVELSAACADTDLVSVAFVAVNLGSVDFSDQLNAAGEIGMKVSQKIAEIYLEVVDLYVQNSGIPLGQVWATAIDKLSPIIIDSIGAAWEDVIIPVVGEVVEYLQTLLGRPDCNGEVFHDLVVFEPWSAGTVESWSRTYSAHSPGSCGADPHTAVAYTRERTAESTGEFPNTKPPRVDATESHGAPVETWCRVWADNPTSSSPHIQVAIQPVPIGFGIQPELMTVTIREDIDPRSGVTFEATADIATRQITTLPLFQGDVFGTRKPHVDFDVSTHPLSGSVNVRAVGNLANPAAPIPVQDAVLVSEGPHAHNVSTVPMTQAANVGGIDDPTESVVTADAIVLGDLGVELSLYATSVAGNPLGYFLRYTRADTPLYTSADVMLAQWTPV